MASILPPSPSVSPPRVRKVIVGGANNSGQPGAGEENNEERALLHLPVAQNGGVSSRDRGDDFAVACAEGSATVGGSSATTVVATLSSLSAGVAAEVLGEIELIKEKRQRQISSNVGTCLLYTSPSPRDRG